MFTPHKEQIYFIASIGGSSGNFTEEKGGLGIYNRYLCVKLIALIARIPVYAMKNSERTSTDKEKRSRK